MSPQQAPTEERAARQGRPAVARDASMDLLRSLVENSLDEGYARAAARRGPGGAPPHGGRLVLTAGLVAVGLLFATAAAQTQARSSTSAQARAALTSEIEDRQDANDRLERELARTRSAVSGERRAVLRLSAQGLALDRTLTRLEVRTGVGAVVGPGLVLRLTDADAVATADGDPRTQEGGGGRVTDRDLQTVVNEVWAAGAEAVAVNDQRLTSRSAIRAAGEAILVDFRPLVPPYEIKAIGGPDLRVRLVSGFGGSYLEVLADYGITYAVEDRDRVAMPASAGVSLRAARLPEAVGSAPTADARDRTTGGGTPGVTRADRGRR